VKQELFSTSGNDEYQTPRSIFAALDREFSFTLDPCSSNGNAKTPKYFTPEYSGLLRAWTGETVFMNPPYSETDKWMAKAYGSARDEGAIVVCLVASRTDTRWWHDFAMKGEIRFIRGRIRFDGGKHSAPFPSAIVIFRPSQFKLESWPK
jgi:site-specific DNA-methyltransferase (adenine-specific)